MGKGNTSRLMKQKRAHRKHHRIEKRRAAGKLIPQLQAKKRDASSSAPKPRTGFYTGSYGY